MIGFLMMASLGLAIAMLAGFCPLIALRSFEHGRRDDAAVALLASLASWSALVMCGPAWVVAMLSAGY